MQYEYKIPDTLNLTKERNSNNIDQTKPLQFPIMDSFAQDAEDYIMNLMLLSLKKIDENDIKGYFDQISLLNSIFDEFYDSNFDINTILSDIINLDFNNLLINSLNPEQFNSQDINEILSLILIFSTCPNNYQYFKESHIFEYIFNLLKLNHQFLFQNCILIFNKYICTYQPSDFSLDLNLLMNVLKQLAKNALFEGHYIEAYKKIILYTDASRHFNVILYSLNSIILKTKSVDTLYQIIEIIKLIFDIDPLNIRLIFQSKVIHNLIKLINTRLLKKYDYYHSILEQFFEFIKYSFMNINSEYQDKIIFVIGIETFVKIFDKINNDKVIFIIHLIFIQYIYSHVNDIIFNEKSQFIDYILNINFIEDLLQYFNEQNFQIKKQILIIIQMLLKTKSNQLFSQLINNKNANYIDECADFALNNDDLEIQMIFLDSFISLVQISERNGQKKLITCSPVINEFISNCSNIEDQKIHELSQEIFNIIVNK